MEITRYMISSDPVDYGEDCKNGFSCAEEVHVQLDYYAVTHGITGVEFEIVGQNIALGNRSTGDQDIIDELDRVREENWVDWMPQDAYRS